MKLNNKTLLCKLGTIVLLIGAAGCGKSADTVPVDENAASTAEETVIEDTEPALSDAPSEEKEVSSSALPSTITNRVGGYPSRG